MQQDNRRPLASRQSKWATGLASSLVKFNISPNTISVMSVLPAIFSAWLLAFPNPFSPIAQVLLVAVCVQLRLLCNLLDGMVAIEGGKKSNVGGMYNEVPDRIADSLFIVALGYAIGIAWIGWLGALLAAITAYIRVLGGSLGVAQDFRGPMAKQHRMFVLTIACILSAIELYFFESKDILTFAAWVIAVGSGITCITRSLAMSRELNSR